MHRLLASRHRQLPMHTPHRSVNRRPLRGPYFLPLHSVHPPPPTGPFVLQDETVTRPLARLGWASFESSKSAVHTPPALLPGHCLWVWFSPVVTAMATPAGPRKAAGSADLFADAGGGWDAGREGRVVEGNGRSSRSSSSSLPPVVR